jgi:hypothetical protein
MKVKVAQFELLGSKIVVVVTDSEFTQANAGSVLILRVQPHYPTQAIMVVSVEQNGFRAFAHFQTTKTLAIMQLELLDFMSIDLSEPPFDNSDLPF